MPVGRVLSHLGLIQYDPCTALEANQEWFLSAELDIHSEPGLVWPSNKTTSVIGNNMKCYRSSGHLFKTNYFSNFVEKFFTSHLHTGKISIK